MRQILKDRDRLAGEGVVCSKTKPLARNVAKIVKSLRVFRFSELLASKEADAERFVTMVDDIIRLVIKVAP